MKRSKILEMISNHTISSRVEEGTDLIHEIYVNDFVDDLLKSIANTPCCTNLKEGDKKLNFKEWKYNKGMRYLSGHTYKDNDGDLYYNDELEKMYQNYLQQ